MSFLLDTTFLIDLERESKNSKNNGPAFSFLNNHKNKKLEISIITVGEFSVGFSNETKSIFSSYLSHFPVLVIDGEVAWVYGQIFLKLKKSGKLIGSNDLWIAATALRNKKTLVTRNIKDYKKIPDLKVISY